MTPRERYVLQIEQVRGMEYVSLVLTDGRPRVFEPFYETRRIELPEGLEKLSLDELIKLYKAGFFK